MLNKVIISIFACLVLVVSAEIMCIFVFSKKPANTPSQIVSVTTPAQVSNIPTTPPKKPATQAINTQAITNYLRVINTDVLVSSQFLNTYRGVIADIKTGSSYKPDPNAPTSTVGEFTIRGLKKGLTDTFYFTQQNMTVLQVKDVSGTHNNPIQLSDLKVGDTVEIKEVLDFTKPPSQFKQSITINKI